MHNVTVVILNLLVCYVQRIYITRIRMAFSIIVISEMMLVYPQSCPKPQNITAVNGMFPTSRIKFWSGSLS